MSSTTIAAFVAACESGDIASLNAMLQAEPALVRERNAEGSTGLHAAIEHPDCVRLLLQHGADPNARDRGMADLLIDLGADLYEPFYGGRQFSVGDPNGVELVFQSQ